MAKGGKHCNKGTNDGALGWGSVAILAEGLQKTFTEKMQWDLTAGRSSGRGTAF